MRREALICGWDRQLILFLFALTLFSVVVAQNPIVAENAHPGSPFSEWGVSDFKDNRIAGFATKMSLNAGETVRFKIDVPSWATYTIRIYRIGYYGGNGARLVQNLGSFNGIGQPACLNNTTTGLLDCGNWSESASWPIPASAVSGLYIAKLERTGGGANHIAFIVRNDASTSDLYLQFPDATWQAYNGYGGANLYNGNTSFPAGHAVKVSYNRPFFVYNINFGNSGGESDWYMNNAYPMIRWIERNGYNITYTSSSDVANNLNHLLNHKVFIVAGHDEYLSKEQRNNFAAARDAGIHLAFFSGNEIYWKTRWESFDGSEHRTLVCYKEGTLGNGTFGLDAERSCGFKCDNTSPEWTGLWRMGGDYDAGRPENELTGQISWDQVAGAIQVPSQYKKLRFWRNTSVANLSAGQTATLAPNSLGYEWDYEQYFESYPPGRITMSSTTLNGHTHKLSLYRHPSGALVFGAGTIQWAWGLDGEHFGGTAVTSQPMQQATVNLFADMGVQPGTLQSGLVPAGLSTDVSGPSSTISSPANNSSFPAGTLVTISGTATDAGGGVVAAVEISLDGGTTWKQANMSDPDLSVTWNYTFTTTSSGTLNLRSRGFDDSGNVEGFNGGGGGSSSTTIFQPASGPTSGRLNDAQSLELGVKFLSTQNGFISGIRYYKASGTTGTRTGHLWTSSGTLLASATFSNETASGWQQASFTTPVAISANATYVASYFSSSGDYVATNPYFTQAVVNGSLRALASGENGPNGVYKYSATPAFPTDNYQTANYWVDVVFNAGNVDNTPPTISSVSPLNGATAVGAGTTVVANFSEAINASTVTATTCQLKNAANIVVAATLSTVSNRITLTPSTALAASTVYTATIKGGSTGVKDLAGNALAGDFSWSFTTGAASSGLITIFQPTNTPSKPLNNDGSPIELGMKFRSSQNGFITGIRFYKGAGTTGTHIGNLWNSSGTRLATATFINETTSGWQQVLFSSPVAINANTTYVASYFSSSGDYPATNFYFDQAVMNGPLRALAGGEDGPNGVYLYTATTAFPTNFNGTTNYWVDVVFNTGSVDNTPPTITSVSPLNGATAVSAGTTVVANFSEAINASTVTATTCQLKNPANIVIAATLITASNRITLTPSAALAASTVYTATIKGGSTGVKDLAGNALAGDFNWSFTTAASDGGGSITIFQPANTPSKPLNNDGSPIELGMKFRSSQNGFITGIRFYKGAGTTGTHIGNLWNTSGTRLATATFINETASGWQQVLFSSPVAINANTTYVASYFSSSGDYPATNFYFDQAVMNGPLRALAGGEDGPNGVYLYTATTAFPTNFNGTTNYWVDVVFNTGSVDNTPPTITSVSPLNGATAVSAGTTVVANFSEAINASTVTATTCQLKNPANIVIAATLITASNRITLTPSAALAASTVYTATIKGGSTGVKDLAGNALAGDFNWSFTTAASDGGGSITIFQPANTPSKPLNNDGSPIELGMKFRSSQNGFITGIRFYKGAGTTGTHIGNLWNTSGTRLATATFINETASGWQQVLFSSPVAINANTTYVASYFSSSGDYPATNFYFDQAVMNGPLRALASGEDGPNGVYLYTATSAFPTNFYQSTNYWVDVVFNNDSSPITLCHPAKTPLTSLNYEGTNLEAGINLRSTRYGFITGIPGNRGAGAYSHTHR